MPIRNSLCHSILYFLQCKANIYAILYALFSNSNKSFYSNKLPFETNDVDFLINKDFIIIIIMITISSSGTKRKWKE